MLPPWQQKILPTIIAATGRQLKHFNDCNITIFTKDKEIIELTVLNDFHNLMLHRRLPRNCIFVHTLHLNKLESQRYTYIPHKIHKYDSSPDIHDYHVVRKYYSDILSNKKIKINMCNLDYIGSWLTLYESRRQIVSKDCRPQSI